MLRNYLTLPEVQAMLIWFFRETLHWVAFFTLMATAFAGIIAGIGDDWRFWSFMLIMAFIGLYEKRTKKH
jgi:hypothetical protein